MIPLSNGSDDIPLQECQMRRWLLLLSYHCNAADVLLGVLQKPSRPSTRGHKAEQI